MPSLREALEESYDAIDGGVDLADASAGEADAGAVAENAHGDTDGLEGDSGGAPSSEDRARDQTGKFVAKPAASDKQQPSSPAARPGATGQGAAAGATVSTAAPVAPPAFKAPQSWKANVRELAARLPPEFRPIIDEALRRDKEAAQALQARAEAEKGHGAWSEVVRPYEAQIRAAGQQPAQYVGTLLQTAHALSYGHPQQKASIVAGLAMQFGITPQDLDSALVAAMNGHAPPQQRQQQPQDFRDSRLDQFFAQQQEQAAAEAGEAAGGFADSHEFFNDVAPTIADILDTWKSQGKKHVTEADMERAYDIACNMNPDVQEAMKQREAASRIATVTAATQQARRASSSVGTSPATGGKPVQSRGLRQSLEEAYDDLDR